MRAFQTPSQVASDGQWGERCSFPPAPCATQCSSLEFPHGLGENRIRKLVVVPSGGLGILPLGSAKDAATGRRFADLYELSFSPSIRAYVEARLEVAAPAAASLIAIHPDSGPPLASAEVAIIANLFPAAHRPVLNGHVTGDAVLEALPGKTYWHFATHGFFEWSHPGHSGLALSQKNTMTMDSIRNAVRLGRPRLVVLSACETGIYDPEGVPDEFFGLGGAFAALGAAGVVGALWQVDDLATALLMTKFYERHVVASLPPPAALRAAQMWLRDTSRRELEAFLGALQPMSAALELQNALSGTVGRSTVSRIRTPPVKTAKGLAGALADASVRIRDRLNRIAKSKSAPFGEPYFWAGFVYVGC